MLMYFKTVNSWLTVTPNYYLMDLTNKKYNDSPSSMSKLVDYLNVSKSKLKLSYLHSTKLMHPLHSSPPTHPLTQFLTLALARPSPTSRRSSTARIRVRRSPTRETPVLDSSLICKFFMVLAVKAQEKLVKQ